MFNLRDINTVFKVLITIGPNSNGSGTGEKQLLLINMDFLVVIWPNKGNLGFLGL